MKRVRSADLALRIVPTWIERSMTQVINAFPGSMTERGPLALCMLMPDLIHPIKVPGGLQW